MASNTKNLTITLGLDEYGDLEYLVDYFQDQSISTVTKTDVIKFMIKQMKRTVQQDLVSDYNKMLSKAEKEDKEDNE
jgi:hypothetical protein